MRCHPVPAINSACKVSLQVCHAHVANELASIPAYSLTVSCMVTRPSYRFHLSSFHRGGGGGGAGGGIMRIRSYLAPSSQLSCYE